MKKQVCAALCLAWAAVLGLAGPSGALQFYYENLGNLGGTELYRSFGNKIAGSNDLGQVVGSSYATTGYQHAFFKAPLQQMQDLGVLTGGEPSFACCINNSGTIGGYYFSAAGDQACLWELAGGHYTFRNLVGAKSKVFGLNDAGYAVGQAFNGISYYAYVKPPEGEPVNLGGLPGSSGSIAYDINNSRTIVGYSFGGGTTTACYWQPEGAG
jgi:probable HAF family extracellular repeat protein